MSVVFQKEIPSEKTEKVTNTKVCQCLSNGLKHYKGHYFPVSKCHSSTLGWS